MILCMFDHVDIRVSDREVGRRFYTTVLGEPTGRYETYDEWGDFDVVCDDKPVTRHLHVGFAAQSRDEVDEFWRRGVDAGYTSDGEPGPRPQYSSDYYGAFLLDPDGNSIEKVHHGDSASRHIDHLWIGVADLAAQLRFWQTVAPVLGLHIKETDEGRFHVASDTGSFALVADGRPATENLHVAFPVADDATVAEFHRVATAAGFRDNGGPGERPEYHAGYVGAFVLDPDGHNIEAVNHNR